MINTTEQPCYAEIFRQTEAVLLAFPLYTDAMPGIVKAFIEKLRPPEPQAETGKPFPGRQKILFLVQSGFPEAVQLAAVEKYLRKLARRLNCECAGVIIKGSGEGIQEMPARMTRKLFERLAGLGELFGKNEPLDEQLLKKIRGPEHLPVLVFLLVYLLKWTGLIDLFWNKTLKENNAFDQRFDRPYV